MRHALFVLALGAGCYSPSADALRCQYRCGEGGDCPSGLVCNSGSMCAAASDDSCSDVVLDGGGDGGTDGTSCDWPATSNVDPCTFARGETTVDWRTFEEQEFLDLDERTGIPAGVGVYETLVGNADAIVLVVNNFTVDAATTLHVHSSRPVIILARGAASIDGAIAVAAVSTDACNPVDGAPAAEGTGGGGGGAGGGFGSDGGAGGSGALDGQNTGGGIGATGGGAFMLPSLVPLRGGCRGGRGGESVGVVASEPGLGGGALQISARENLSVAGRIVAHGLGGGAGSGADGMTPCAGGSGGGSGGAILLEAPVVDLAGATFCAMGGAGGGILTPGGGSDTSCGIPAAGTGITNPDTSIDSRGGLGASSTVSAAQSGGGVSFAASYGRPGGGGGGGLGIVRVNAGSPITGTPTTLNTTYSTRQP